MNLLPKRKPPPPDDPAKDRLSFSMLGFKVEAVGDAVNRGFVLSLAMCVVVIVLGVAYVVKPFPIPSPVAAASGLVAKAR